MGKNISNSSLRELRTAVDAWDRAEYSGGRERAAAFLAMVARDLLTGIGNIDEPDPRTQAKVINHAHTNDQTHARRSHRVGR
jgi:hypothetical protein